MKCSFPACHNNAIKVCSFHNYAVCQIHLSKHTDICRERLYPVELYQSQISLNRTSILSAFNSSKLKVVNFSQKILKKVKELTDSKLKQLNAALQKENFNELQLDFRNEELNYLTFIIEYVFKFKSFEADVKNSEKIKMGNGKVLKGLFDSNLSGFGEIEYQNGTKYVGGLLAGAESGLGYNLSASGSRYFGGYSKGVKSGVGVYAISGERSLNYQGFLGDGEKNGFGVLNGHRFCYEGNFEKGLFKGLGKIRYTDGSSYEGEFLDDKITGYGAFIFPNNDKYIGYMRNSLLHGAGIYYYHSGEIFEGMWVENKKSGRGKLTKSNGETFEGDWN